MKIIRWIVVNGLFFGFVFFGVVKDIEGAMGVTTFLVWAIGFISLFLTSEHMVNEISKSGFSVPFIIDATFDIAIVSMLAYGDYWVLAGVYFFHIIMAIALRSKIEQKRSELITPN